MSGTRPKGLGHVQRRLLDEIDAAGGRPVKVIPDGAALTPAQAEARRRAARQLAAKGLAGTWRDGTGRRRVAWIATPDTARRMARQEAEAAIYARQQDIQARRRALAAYKDTHPGAADPIGDYLAAQDEAQAREARLRHPAADGQDDGSQGGLW